jgi:hypothetical protein
MSASLISEARFVCKCKPDQRSACWPERYPEPYKETGYCVLHFPGEEKSDEFEIAFDTKLKDGDYDFRGVWFPYELKKLGEHSFETNAVFEFAVFTAQADFSHANFGKRADFNKAVFKQQAKFNSANFIGRANFDNVCFKGNANFDRANFRARAGFNAACFRKRASFESATFHDRINFGEARFNGEVNFRLTNFKDYVRFAGTKNETGPVTTENEFFLDKSLLDLREVKIDKPELVSFNTLTLRPFWFVEVSASKFDFSNVTWKLGTLSEEVAEIRKAPELVRINCEKESYASLVRSPYTPLGIACWNLAVNAEENHRYEEASRFRYMAMDARRQTWKEGETRLARLFRSWKRNRTARFSKSFWKDRRLLDWLYWASSGYGERISRAFMVLVIIWVVFAGAYAKVVRDKKTGAPLRWRAPTYSLGVMMLQKPEPPPSTILGQSLVLLETVLGPVQAGLLALAIRRRFMR